MNHLTFFDNPEFRSGYQYQCPYYTSISKCSACLFLDSARNCVNPLWILAQNFPPQEAIAANPVYIESLQYLQERYPEALI